MNLSTYNFLLTVLLGLGMSTPNNVSIPYTVLDGARYLRTTKPQRTLSLPGRFQADDPVSFATGLSAMRSALDRDLVGLQQPLVLVVEPQDECGNVIGDFAQIPCLYAGGLDGNDGNYPVEDAAPTFTMYLPYLVGGSGAGQNVIGRVDLPNANRVLRRNANGLWQTCANGLGNLGALTVQTIAALQDGRVFFGGDYTVASGAPDSYGILYNPATDTFSTMGGGGQLTGVILGSAVGPNGILYLVGSFLNAAGIANADNIVAYNPTADTFAALGTGANGQVNTVAVGPTGLVYVGTTIAVDIGGIGTSNGIAYWDGGAWNAMGTGISGAGTIFAIQPVGTRVYVGGSMTGMSGVANTQRVAYWDGAAWVSQTTTPPDSSVLTILLLPNGILSYGGLFTGKQAYWNGAGFQYLAQLNGSVNNQDIGLNGAVWAGGDFTQIGAVTLPDSLAQLYGTVYVPADVNLPGTASIKDVKMLPSGDLYVGFNTAGTANAALPFTMTNTGPGQVYPVLTFSGPAAGTARIYQVGNLTTSVFVYFDLTINAGEVITMTFDPANPTFISTFQGNVGGSVLPGSQPSLFSIAPGAAALTFFTSSVDVLITISWQKRYNGYADLVN